MPLPLTDQHVIALIRVTLRAMRLQPLMVALPQRVLARCNRLKVGRVHAPTVPTIRSTWARLVVAVALVVDLHAVRDRPDEDLVCPPMGDDDLLTWTGAELSVSVPRAVWAGPHPASVRLWSCHSVESG